MKIPETFSVKWRKRDGDTYYDCDTQGVFLSTAQEVARILSLTYPDCVYCVFHADGRLHSSYERGEKNE